MGNFGRSTAAQPNVLVVNVPMTSFKLSMMCESRFHVLDLGAWLCLRKALGHFQCIAMWHAFHYVWCQFSHLQSQSQSFFCFIGRCLQSTWGPCQGDAFCNFFAHAYPTDSHFLRCPRPQDFQRPIQNRPLQLLV